MGTYWTLLLSGNEVLSFGHRLPYAVLLGFDKTDLKVEERPSEGFPSIKLQSTCGRVRKKLEMKGVQLAELEKAVSLMTGIPITILRDSTPFVVSKDEDGLGRFLFKRYKDLDIDEDEFKGSNLDIFFWIDYADEVLNFPDIFSLYLLCAIAYLGEPMGEEVSLDLTQWFDDPDDASSVFEDTESEFVSEYLNFREVFSFVDSSPSVISKVEEKMKLLNEDALITTVLIPLLEAMGHKGVSRNAFHGPGESGRDILPFFKEADFGKRVYFVAQAKAARVHAKAQSSGSVQEVLNQARAALAAPFLDGTDNTMKRPDFVFLFLAGGITTDARKQLEDSLADKEKNMIVVDSRNIAREFCKYGLSSSVL